jgi:hypothetical protein
MAPKSRKRIIITPTIVIDAAFTGAMRVAFTGVIAVATITDRSAMKTAVRSPLTTP